MQQVLLNIVLDESGSMDKVRDATVSQFKEYLNSLKKQADAKYFLSLTKFNTVFECICTGKALSEVNDDILSDYTPKDMTALYDAVVDTVKRSDEWLREEAEHNRTYKVLCVILTDGQENSSKQYNRQQVFDLLEEKEATGYWTFVYLGANQDSWAVGQSIGVTGKNTINYVATPEGLATARTNLSASTQRYARASYSNTNDFWKEPEPATEED